MQVGAVALKESVRRKREENIEIARGAAAYARLALAGKPDAGAVLNPRRNVDRKGTFPRRPPNPAVGRAGVLDDLAAPLAGRTGALEREEALGVPDLTLAAACRADLRLGARLGAASRAGFAGDRGRN